MLKKGIRVTASGLLLLLVFSGISSVAQKQSKPLPKPHVVYVGTPYDVISIMIEMAQIKKEDLVYDLGCGDGRMVVLAAQKCLCRGIGYEIDPIIVQAANENVLKNQMGSRVKIVNADIFTLDLRKATVLLLYLLPELNKRLLPQIDAMKPGTRIVCHNYDIPGIVADKTLTYLSNEDNTTHIMTRYTTPLKRMSSANVTPAPAAPTVSR